MENKVVVIGAGLAGLMCSIKCAENGLKVILVSRMPSERAQSVMAAGGINAAINTKGENDNTRNHYTDTIKAGVYLAEEAAVKGLTDNAPQIVNYLADIGMMFNRTEDGKIDLRNFGGQKKKRTAFAQSSTGKQLISALVQEVRKYEADGLIKVYDHHSFVTYIRGRNNECIGCIIKNNINEKMMCVNGQATVICTGGMNGIFGKTTGSVLNTGSAAAEIFSRGVSMGNLEFIQYHPTTVEVSGKRMLVSESARGEGGRLFTYVNNKPWYFMEQWYPEMGALMPRDVVARGIYKVCNDMNILIDGEKKVYLDITHLGDDVLNNKLSGLVEDCKKYFNLDPAKEYIPVYPGIHYFMGGIYVNRKHETTVQNLYAAGECCMQYHGANRLGGNSTLGAIYGGKVSADSIERCFKEDSFTHYDESEIKSFNKRELNYISAEIECIKNGKKSIPLTKIKRELHKIMNDSLGIVRDEAHLNEGIRKLGNLYKDEVKDNYDKMSSECENYNMKNMIFLGKAVLESALSRKESRGAHFRKDYPERNDKEYRKTSIAMRVDDKIYISYKEQVYNLSVIE